ncbi:MAG: DinB family protein [Hyphomicrobiales bacterium]|nr:damage-inducible protein DinB [Alphaproteobacteria bacterium]
MSALVSPGFVRTMAAYNAEMNRRLYAAAGRIPDPARRQDRGAFWGSLHGTLCHLVWGDQMWMSRFDDWPKPDVIQKNSATLIASFDELCRVRIDADDRISAWAGRVTNAWLAEDLVWFSSSAHKELRSPRSFAIAHFFNHQTHHRGQAHGLITACGEKTGNTDLFLVVEPVL